MFVANVVGANIEQGTAWVCYIEQLSSVMEVLLHPVDETSNRFQPWFLMEVHVVNLLLLGQIGANYRESILNLIVISLESFSGNLPT